MSPMKLRSIPALPIAAALSVVVGLGLAGSSVTAQGTAPVQLPARPAPSPQPLAPVIQPAPIAPAAAISVIARAAAFEAPESMPSGRVTINFQNATGNLANAQISRLNPGVTMADVSPVLEAEDEAAFYSLVTPAGGIGIIGAGRSQTVTLNLTVGDYFLLNFGDEQPVVHPFRVLDSGVSQVAEPRADGEVLMDDFSFILPALRAGSMTLRVPNRGTQPHEMLIGKLAPGITMRDILEFEEDPVEAGMVDLWGGLSTIAGGETAWVGLNLTPGTYGMICFVPDPASGKPHFELGMVAEFTVP